MESIVADISLSPKRNRGHLSLVRSLDLERAALAEAMLACYLDPDDSISLSNTDAQPTSPWTTLQECSSTYMARARERGMSPGRIVFDLIALARKLPSKKPSATD